MNPTSDRNHSDPIVITGRGLISALGLDWQTTWRQVCEGRSGLGALTALEQTPASPKTGGQAPELPAAGDEDAAMPREVRYLRHALLAALTEAHLTPQASGLKPLASPYAPERCGLIFGTTLHGMRSGGAFFRQNNAEPLRRFQASAVLEQAAGDLGLRGLAATTCAACSSGLSSLALGITLLKAGKLDLVLAGGYDPVSEYAYAGFNSLRLIADEPPRPFGLNRPGMKLGEGYGVLVLERLSDARQRGATVLGQVLGFGESADAHHLTQPHPEGRGAIQAIRQALDDAGLEPADIDLITAHATGTPDNDRGEATALRQVFGDRLPQVPIVAIKSRLGHTLGGAGAVELILALCALRDQQVPPTDHVEPERLEFPELRFTRGRSEPARLRTAMNLSIGFGGANTCMIIGPPPPPEMSPPPETPPETPPACPLQWACPHPPRQVAITGIGVILPGMIGNDALAAHAATAADLVTQQPGTIDDAALLDLLATPRARRMSDYVKVELAAARLACRDAGLDQPGAFDPRDAVVAGSTHGSAAYCADYYRQIVEQGIEAANPMLFAEGVPNAGAAHLSLLFGLTGPCQTIIGSRTAGLDALHLAATRIAQGHWSRAMVSAAEEATGLIREGYRHCGLHARCAGGAAFAPAEGFVIGSGAVTLILEDRAAAEARGAAIHGIVQDTATGFAPASHVRELMECWRAMLGALGRPEAVISSANSTWLGRIEAAAIATAAEHQTTVTSVYGHIAETFSVNPFAAIAWVLLTRRLPRLLGGGPDGAKLRAAEGSESPRSFAVLTTDYAGPLAAATIRVGG